MKMICLGVLFFLAAFSGVSSQIQLTQSGAEIKKPGESVKVTCETSGYTFTSYYISWVRQAPGKALEWIGYINPTSGDTGYAQTFQGRFTITRDTSISTAYLQLGSLRTDDTATYYCARGMRGGSLTTIVGAADYFDYWGQGTMVTVTTVSPVAPSVFPLTSCTGEGTTSQVTFGCLAKGYFPEPVTMTWSPNVGSSVVKTYPSVLQPSSNLYSLSSQVTVPASSWESDTYRCTVEHQPTSSSISTEIPKPTPNDPKVKVLYSCNTQQDAVELVCFISGFYPDNFTVEWLVNGVSGQLKGDTEPLKKDANGRTFSTRSNAKVSKSKWLEGEKYTCLVSQPGSTPKQAQASKCEG